MFQFCSCTLLKVVWHICKDSRSPWSDFWHQKNSVKVLKLKTFQFRNKKQLRLLFCLLKASAQMLSEENKSSLMLVQTCGCEDLAFSPHSLILYPGAMSLKTSARETMASFLMVTTMLGSLTSSTARRSFSLPICDNNNGHLYSTATIVIYSTALQLLLTRL